MLTALLFDLDGTLTHTDPIHFQTWKEILRDYELEIDRPFYENNFSGRTNAAILNQLLPHLSVEKSRQLGNQKEAAFRRQATGELQPIAGLTEVLAWANERQLKQAVVTNAPPENAEFMLQVLELTQQFATVVLAETLERAKPDPLAYQVGLDRLGAAANCAIAFEDSPSGIRSAVGAGILTVGIASTHLPEELYAVGATLVVTDFSDRTLYNFLNCTFEQPLGIGG
ncbi:HAD family hydrolase [Leptolyngbyaceae cyanobacterium UHCC 1019]